MLELSSRLAARWPGAEAICFGHLADSNLHMFVKVDERPFPEHAIDEIVYGCVRDWQGSISAEHGIGLLKKDYLDYSRTPEEIALMKRVRLAMDPKGILNPARFSREDSSAAAVTASRNPIGSERAASRLRSPHTAFGKCASSANRGITCQCTCGTMLRRRTRD